MFNPKKFLIWLLVVLVSFSFSLPYAFADLLEEKKEELKAINEAIEQQEKLLTEKRKQSLSLKNQVDILEGEIKKTELSLNRTQLSLESVKSDLSSLNGKLVETEVSITEKKLVLGSVIRFAYERARFGVLELLVTAQNLTDLLNRWEYISTIERKVGELLESLGGLKEELTQEKDSLEEKTDELRRLEGDLVAQENSLNFQRQAKEYVLSETLKSETEYQRRLEEAQQEQKALMAEIQRLAAARGKKFVGPQELSWPIGSRLITAIFLDKDYERRFGIPHYAIDIATSFQTPIKTPADGEVIKIRFLGDTSYAYMMIAHDNGLVTVYGHISQPLVAVGTYVVEGQPIALSGGIPGTVGAGWLTTGAHLHFEVWKEGQAVNPLNYLS